MGELKRKLDAAQAKAKELEDQEKDTQVTLAGAHPNQMRGAPTPFHFIWLLAGHI